MNFPFCGIGKLKLPTTNNSYLQTFILFKIACVLDLCRGHTHTRTCTRKRTGTRTRTRTRTHTRTNTHAHTYYTHTTMSCAQVYW